MTSLTLVPPPPPDEETATIKAEANLLVQEANDLAITDQKSFEYAAEWFRHLKNVQGRISKFFEPLKKKAHEAHKMLCDTENQYLKPTKEAEKIAETKMSEWRTKERRRLEAEQREREALAKKLEEDRLLDEAAALEAAGETELAESLIAEPVVAPCVAVAPAAPKAEGIAWRKTWSAEVTDLHALVRYVAEHPEQLGLLSVNAPALNALARAMKDSLAIPGVRAIATESAAAR